MISLFFNDSPLLSGHAVRGIGFYTRNLKSILGRQSDLKLVDDISKANMVHYPYFDLFFKSLSFQKGKKNIVTIYDTIPLIYPKNYPPGIKGKINFLRQKSTLKEADAIVTISETSKKDIVRFLDVQSEKVHATYLTATPDFKKLPSGKWSTEIRQKYHLPEKFVLYVGDVNYNKNINNLAKACKITDVPLVLAGKQAASSDFDRNHPENQSLVHLLEEYGYDHQVLRLGFVPQEDLVKIMNLADVYCQPSLYEGFGLPILEAMTCDIPVVASKIQVFVELFEKSVLYFDPYDVNNMSNKISQALGERKTRDTLIKMGQIKSKNYSWDKTARDTVDVYKSLE